MHFELSDSQRDYRDRARAIAYERLAPGYHGWFAGVPVQINSLGFRDTREYTLEKSHGAFRIVVSHSEGNDLALAVHGEARSLGQDLASVFHAADTVELLQVELLDQLVLDSAA